MSDSTKRLLAMYGEANQEWTRAVRASKQRDVLLEATRVVVDLAPGLEADVISRTLDGLAVSRSLLAQIRDEAGEAEAEHQAEAHRISTLIEVERSLSTLSGVFVEEDRVRLPAWSERDVLPVLFAAGWRDEDLDFESSEVVLVRRGAGALHAIKVGSETRAGFSVTIEPTRR